MNQTANFWRRLTWLLGLIFLGAGVALWVINRQSVGQGPLTQSLQMVGPPAVRSGGSTDGLSGVDSDSGGHRWQVEDVRTDQRSDFKHAVRVLDSLTGGPVSNAELRWDSGKPEPSCDGDGPVWFPCNGASGVFHVLEVSGKGYLSRRVEIACVLRSGCEFVYLTPVSSLEIEIISQDGHAVWGAQVSLESVTWEDRPGVPVRGQNARRVRTDKAGLVRFPKLPMGARIELVANSRESPPVRFWTILQEASNYKRVVLEKGARILLDFRSHPERPEAEVWVRRSGGRTYYEFVSGASKLEEGCEPGLLALDRGFAPGSYDIQVTKPGRGVLFEDSLRLERDDLILTIPWVEAKAPQGSVLFVRGHSGVPIHHARVQYGQRMYVTDEEGACKVMGNPGREQLLTVTAPGFHIVSRRLMAQELPTEIRLQPARDGSVVFIIKGAAWDRPREDSSVKGELIYRLQRDTRGGPSAPLVSGKLRFRKGGTSESLMLIPGSYRMSFWWGNEPERECLIQILEDERLEIPLSSRAARANGPLIQGAIWVEYMPNGRSRIFAGEGPAGASVEPARRAGCDYAQIVPFQAEDAPVLTAQFAGAEPEEVLIRPNTLEGLALSWAFQRDDTGHSFTLTGCYPGWWRVQAGAWNLIADLRSGLQVDWEPSWKESVHVHDVEERSAFRTSVTTSIGETWCVENVVSDGKGKLLEIRPAVEGTVIVECEWEGLPAAWVDERGLRPTMFEEIRASLTKVSVDISHDAIPFSGVVTLLLADGNGKVLKFGGRRIVLYHGLFGNGQGLNVMVRSGSQLLAVVDLGPRFLTGAAVVDVSGHMEIAL